MFDARKLHAAIFPAPRHTGTLRFAYRDRPRLGIGGDLLSAHDGPDGSLHLILLDVSGDGIGAALTVHRLHGEIERLFAENPTLDPLAALRALDRYSHLTLMPHGIVAVMFAMQLHTDGRLDYAGAGHTPAFIRRLNGQCDRLESQSWILGAHSNTPEDLTIGHDRLDVGDVLIAHSDGACNWTNRAGERLGYHGAQSIVRLMNTRQALDVPDQFLRTLDKFHGGDPQDAEDVLIVALEFCPEATGAFQGARGLNRQRALRRRTAAVAIGGRS
jgi:serine phosphatase RsbU (regulator of sigma subunit)